MSIEQNKALVRRFYDEWNKGNLEGLLDLCSDDVVDHNPGEIQPAGKAGMKQALETFLTAFPDSKIELENLIAEGDMVVDHTSLRGTHTGDLMGIPPTGKPVTVYASDAYRIRNGKIVEIWHVEDVVRVLQQIGVIPAPQS